MAGLWGYGAPSDGLACTLCAARFSGFEALRAHRGDGALAARLVCPCGAQFCSAPAIIAHAEATGHADADFIAACRAAGEDAAEIGFDEDDVEGYSDDGYSDGGGSDGGAGEDPRLAARLAAALEAAEQAGVDVRLADRVLVRGRARLARHCPRRGQRGRSRRETVAGDHGSS